MVATFVLVHSPSVGPATWQPVAERLTDLGYPTVVPSLLSVGVGPPPYWPRIVSAIADAVPADVGRNSVVLVAHSNAGCFMPVAAEALGDSLAGCVFVDAKLPALPGPTEVAPPELLDSLESLAVCAEQPRRPLEYYRQSVPVPSGWNTIPGAYLAFSPAYDADLTRAVERGWPTERLAGEHLHQIVDPVAVAERIIALAATMTKVLGKPELQQLRDDHAPAVLAFERANRSYFAASISDRGDEYFQEFTARHSALLADQASGIGAYYVLVADDGSVVGRFNLSLAGDGSAELGYRVAESVAGRGVATTAVRELCMLAAEQHGVHTLRAATTPANIASQKVLLKAGFVAVGPAKPEQLGGKTGTCYERSLSGRFGPASR